MIKLFNNNHPTVYLSLLALTFLGHLAILFEQVQPVSVSIETINVFILWLQKFPVALFLAVSITTFLNSILFNSLLIEKDNIARNSHLPAALFIILSAIVSKQGYFLQNQFMLIFLLVGVFFLQKMELDKDEVSSSFFTGFFISLTSMFNPGAVIILFIALLKVADYRWSLARVFLLQVLGFVVPFYLVWTLHFLFDKGSFFVNNYFSSFKIELISFEFQLANKILFGSLIFFGLIALLAVVKSENWKSVQPRAWIRFWVILGSVFLVISLFVPSQNQSLVVAMLPLAGFLPYSLVGAKRKILRSALFYALLVIVALDQLVTLRYLSL